MFELWFYGNDGEFSYLVGTYKYPEMAFRHANARASILGWTFGGASWTTVDNHIFESGHIGRYYIIRE